MARREGVRPLRLRRIVAEAARLYVHGFTLLLAAGVAVFVPVGLAEALGVNSSSVDGLEGPTAVAVVLGTFLFAYLALLGEVLYSGMVTRAVVDERRGERHSIWQILRSLPYRRLIAADVLFVLLVAIGLVLLIVPGFAFLAWFVLVAPVIEVEELGVMAAFRRSRALIRGFFWRVLPLVLAVTIISELIGEAIQVGISGLLGDSFAAEWAGSTLSGLATAPLWALPIVVLYLELAERSVALEDRLTS